jgi:hypothetical protein
MLNILELVTDKIKSRKEKKLIKKIVLNASSIPYNPDAIYTGDKNRLILCENGTSGLIQLRRKQNIKELEEILEFTSHGGKVVCLPMFAGVPTPEYVPMLLCSGYTSEKVPEQIKNIPNINLGDMDFHTTLQRSFPLNKDEKKEFDFINCTWADNIKEKRWDLALELVEQLCKKHTMALIVYKNQIPEKDMYRMHPFIKSGKLKLFPEILPKEEFSRLIRLSRVGIVNSEWDARPRYLDQLLLSDVPVLLNENIYGGQNFVREGSGEVVSPEKLAETGALMLKQLDRYKGMRERYLKKHGPYNAVKKLTYFINKILNQNFKYLLPQMAKQFFTKKYIEENAKKLVENEHFFKVFFKNPSS